MRTNKMLGLPITGNYMPEKGIRSTYSQSPVQILMFDDHGLISTGTAFFYSLNNEWFLVTNWHNISGKNFITKDPISGSRFPTYIKAKISAYINDTNGFVPIAQRVEIYKDYQPAWYQHPILGSDCDVIAIPMERPHSCPEYMHNAVNLISSMRIPVKPGNSAFIIGFPKSLSIGFGLPLWKSGYIASEPHYPVKIGGEVSEIGGLKNGKELPAFYIDSQTREGMSGSPVFASYTGNWDLTDPYQAVNPDEKNFWNRNDIALGENRMEFVGCYSGRIGSMEDGAALGLCWTVETINEICNSKSIGDHPHVVQAQP
ncbi:trypsin-like peptidase domain-containing protein [Pseudoalteromonas maricaloris]|uniref:Trypsin-like peptidase domain-containing protein n=1 Tax=Pseudoalteromonas maricaloris TaxID=184924 RepID=A0A8I2KMA0_9GAMM|nr:trypsin-like peptidase domain-containing protein [Pseudoalteromonas maricaloris]NLR21471.1 trypsin-like peptidase domain-containing protein [Pseudoalteromonas maricaloris]WOX30163.1 hypothetical protein R5H13_07865 [Pseudoalteromonas maricaloris]